jgi:hypothetical protein
VKTPTRIGFLSPGRIDSGSAAYFVDCPSIAVAALRRGKPRFTGALLDTYFISASSSGSNS